MTTPKDSPRKRPGRALVAQPRPGKLRRSRKMPPAGPPQTPEAGPSQPGTAAGDLTVLKEHGFDLSTLFATSYSERLEAARKVRRKRTLAKLGLFVVLPTLIAYIYLAFICTPRYVAQTQLVVASSSQGLVNMLGGIVQTTSDSEARYLAFLLEDYIYSVPMVRTINGWLDVRGHFTNPEIDYFSRANKDATDDQFLSYWKRRVEVELDTTTLVMTIRTHAYDPETAKALSDAIVTLCEDMTDQLAGRAREDALKFARGEVERAESRVKDARAKMTEFRNKYGDIDLASAAGAKGATINALEQQLTEARAEQARLSTFMRPDSQPRRSIDSRITALEQQINAERARIAQTEGGSQTYSQRLTEYQGLLLESDLAEKGVASALANMDLARQEAARKHIYIVDFVRALVPDVASEPNPLSGTVTVFLAALVIFGLGSLIIATVKEQARL